MHLITTARVGGRRNRRTGSGNGESQCWTYRRQRDPGSANKKLGLSIITDKIDQRGCVYRIDAVGVQPTANADKRLLKS